MVLPPWLNAGEVARFASPVRLVLPCWVGESSEFCVHFLHHCCDGWREKRRTRAWNDVPGATGGVLPGAGFLATPSPPRRAVSPTIM
jgi:hypothetical protein